MCRMYDDGGIWWCVLSTCVRSGFLIWLQIDTIPSLPLPCHSLDSFSEWTILCVCVCVCSVKFDSRPIGSEIPSYPFMRMKDTHSAAIAAKRRQEDTLKLKNGWNSTQAVHAWIHVRSAFDEPFHWKCVHTLCSTLHCTTLIYCKIRQRRRQRQTLVKPMDSVAWYETLRAFRLRSVYLKSTAHARCLNVRCPISDVS